jgi:hypothetical protein
VYDKQSIDEYVETQKRLGNKYSLYLNNDELSKDDEGKLSSRTKECPATDDPWYADKGLYEKMITQKASVKLIRYEFFMKALEGFGKIDPRGPPPTEAEEKAAELSKVRASLDAQQIDGLAAQAKREQEQWLDAHPAEKAKIEAERLQRQKELDEIEYQRVNGPRFAAEEEARDKKEVEENSKAAPKTPKERYSFELFAKNVLETGPYKNEGYRVIKNNDAGEIDVGRTRALHYVMWRDEYLPEHPIKTDKQVNDEEKEKKRVEQEQADAKKKSDELAAENALKAEKERKDAETAFGARQARYAAAAAENRRIEQMTAQVAAQPVAPPPPPPPPLETPPLINANNAFAADTAMDAPEAPVADQAQITGFDEDNQPIYGGGRVKRRKVASDLESRFFR